MMAMPTRCRARTRRRRSRSPSFAAPSTRSQAASGTANTAAATASTTRATRTLPNTMTARTKCACLATRACTSVGAGHAAVRVFSTADATTPIAVMALARTRSTLLFGSIVVLSCDATCAACGELSVAPSCLSHMVLKRDKSRLEFSCLHSTLERAGAARPSGVRAAQGPGRPPRRPARERRV